MRYENKGGGWTAWWSCLFSVVLIAAPTLASDQSVADELFARIDLSRPELAGVQAAYQGGQYSAALDGYRDVFVDRAAGLDLGSPEGLWSFGATSAAMAYAGEIKIDAMGTGYCTYNIGSPGAVEWFPLPPCYQDFGRDLSTMHWTGALTKGYLAGQGVSYLEQFAAYWDDFATNWMAARPPNGDPYSDTLHWAWKSGLYLAWRIDNFMRFFGAACTESPIQAKAAMSGVQLGRILNQLATLDIPDLAAHRYPTTPNQQVLAIQALLKASAACADFHDAPTWRDFALAKADEYVTAGSYLADGSDQEQSFNYNGGLVSSAQEMIDLIETVLPGDPCAAVVVAQLDQARTYRSRFLELLLSPIGARPATGTASMSPPADYTPPFYNKFTSICFPYGGYSVLRSGWTRDDLYMFFKSSRIGYGHYVEDGLHLTLCAYGRNLLIAGGPNSYSGEAIDSYYRSSFSRNTIAVDAWGQSSRLDNEMPAEGYPDPIAARWHSSDVFDLTEGVYSYGYGDKISDVVHERQVVQVRPFGLFVVTDRLRSTQSHDYTLTWGFDTVFDNSEVHYDAASKRLHTDDSSGANLLIQHCTAAALDVMLYRGATGVADAAAHDIPYLGWYTPVSGHDNNIAKVDAHIKFSAAGDEQVVSLLVPHAGLVSPLTDIQTYANGFDAVLHDGAQVYYRAALAAEMLEAGPVSATAEALLVVQKTGLPLVGLALGVAGQWIAIEDMPWYVESADFEFSADGPALFKKPILMPDRFVWDGAEIDVEPVYYGVDPCQALPEWIWWSMDEAQGQTAADGAGDGWSATLSGAPGWDVDGGVFSGALVLDGVDDQATAACPVVEGAAPRTVAAWVQATQPGPVVSWGGAGPSERWTMEITDEGTLAVSVEGGSVVGATQLLDSGWRHVAVVLPNDAAGWVSAARLYVDGAPETTGMVIDYEVATTAGLLTLGAAPHDSRRLAGRLDDVVVFSRALNDQRIKQLCHAGAASFLQPCGTLMTEPETRPVGDVNYDCRVDEADLALLIGQWLRQVAPRSADLNDDGTVNFADFAVLIQDWFAVAPLLWWPLETGQGTLVLDMGPLGHAGQFFAGTQWTDQTPYSRWAAEFDGVDDYINVLAWPEEICGSNSRTVSVWVRATSCGDLVSWGDPTGQAFRVVIQDEHGWPGTLGVLAGNGYRVGKTDLRDGVWHHVAVVLDAAQPDVWQAKLYVDGVAEGASAFRGQAVDTTPGPITMGAGPEAGSYLTGALDDVRIYHVALDAAAIARLAQ